MNELEKKILEYGLLQPWNHNFVFPDGTETNPGFQQVSHGKNEKKLSRFEPIFDQIDWKGKRVLDVGCNEGFFSFNLAERGAQVLAIDVDDLRIRKAQFVKANLFPDLDVEFCVHNVYDDFDNAEAAFDYILCFGFLHRIPDPFGALQRLTNLSDAIIFEWKALKHGHHSREIAYFSKKEINSSDYYGTEYWLISFEALKTMMRRLKFVNFIEIDDPSQKRGILISSKTPLNIDAQNRIVRRSLPIRLIRAGKESFKLLLDAFTGASNN